VGNRCEAGEEANGLVQLLDLKGIESHLTMAAAVDQGGIAEDTEVIRDGGLGYLQTSSQCAGCALSLTQALQYAQARGVSQGFQEYQLLDPS
jgi:hypothetical protein